MDLETVAAAETLAQALCEHLLLGDVVRLEVLDRLADLAQPSGQSRFVGGLREIR